MSENRRFGVTKNCEWLVIDDSALRISKVDMVDIDVENITLDLYINDNWLHIKGFDDIEECRDIFDRVVAVVSGLRNNDIVEEEEEEDDR